MARPRKQAPAPVAVPEPVENEDAMNYPKMYYSTAQSFPDQKTMEAAVNSNTLQFIIVTDPISEQQALANGYIPDVASLITGDMAQVSAELAIGA